MVPVFLVECKTQHALLNGTYGDCTKTLDDALAEIVHLKKERDDALAQVASLIEANHAKDEELRAEKTTTRGIMTEMLAYTIRIVRGKNEEIARLKASVASLRGEMQSKQSILNATQAHLRRSDRTVTRLQGTIKGAAGK
jgi:chromosome segregation ATPase